MSRRNPCLDAVTAELLRHGLTWTSELRGSGHILVRFAGRVVIVSATNSDSHGPHAARAIARRELRRAGVIRAA
jgi:hypothetical protein